MVNQKTSVLETTFVEADGNLQTEPFKMLKHLLYGIWDVMSKLL